RDSVADARAFLEDLERAGAAGAVIELVDEHGEPADAAIAVLRRAAHGCRMAVAVLVRPIRFVRVTQVAHRLLVGRQLARLERARHVHEVFTRLSLESAT